MRYLTLCKIKYRRFKSSNDIDMLEGTHYNWIITDKYAIAKRDELNPKGLMMHIDLGRNDGEYTTILYDGKLKLGSIQGIRVNMPFTSFELLITQLRMSDGSVPEIMPLFKKETYEQSDSVRQRRINAGPLYNYRKQKR